jgi:hypothetical protein
MALPSAVEKRLLKLWETGAEAVDVYAGAVQNFLPHVEVSSDGKCWLWMGTTHADNGAPEFTWHWPDGRQGNRRVPKLIYELVHQRQLDPTSRVVQNDTCHGGNLCLRPEHLKEESRIGKKRGQYTKSK